MYLYSVVVAGLADRKPVSSGGAQGRGEVNPPAVHSMSQNVRESFLTPAKLAVERPVSRMTLRLLKFGSASYLNRRGESTVGGKGKDGGLNVKFV